MQATLLNRLRHLVSSDGFLDTSHLEVLLEEASAHLAGGGNASSLRARYSAHVRAGHPGRTSSSVRLDDWIKGNRSDPLLATIARTGTDMTACLGDQETIGALLLRALDRCLKADAREENESSLHVGRWSTADRLHVTQLLVAAARPEEIRAAQAQLLSNSNPARRVSLRRVWPPDSRLDALRQVYVDNVLHAATEPHRSVVGWVQAILDPAARRNAEVWKVMESKGYSSVRPPCNVQIPSSSFPPDEPCFSALELDDGRSIHGDVVARAMQHREGDSVETMMELPDPDDLDKRIEIRHDAPWLASPEPCESNPWSHVLVPGVVSMVRVILSIAGRAGDLTQAHLPSPRTSCHPLTLEEPESTWADAGRLLQERLGPETHTNISIGSPSTFRDEVLHALRAASNDETDFLGEDISRILPFRRQGAFDRARFWAILLARYYVWMMIQGIDRISEALGPQEPFHESVMEWLLYPADDPLHAWTHGRETNPRIRQRPGEEDSFHLSLHRSATDRAAARTLLTISPRRAAMAAWLTREWPAARQLLRALNAAGEVGETDRNGAFRPFDVVRTFHLILCQRKGESLEAFEQSVRRAGCTAWSLCEVTEVASSIAASTGRTRSKAVVNRESLRSVLRAPWDKKKVWREDPTQQGRWVRDLDWLREAISNSWSCQ